MFMGNRTHAVWSKLQAAYAAEDRESFNRQLVTSLDQLRQDRDELRLLFCIGREFDEPAYRAMLSLLTDWRFRDSAEKAARCENYLYALTHALPSHLRLAKPWLKPLFLACVHPVDEEASHPASMADKKMPDPKARH